MPEPAKLTSETPLKNRAMRRSLILLACASVIVTLFFETTLAQDFTESVADLSPNQTITDRFLDIPAAQRMALGFADLDRSDRSSLRLAAEQAAFDRSEPASVVLEAPAFQADRRNLPDDSKPADVTPDQGTPLTSTPRPASLLGFQVAPALPPMGHSRFCLHYPKECKVHGVDFRKRNFKMTSRRWDDLNRVNRDVNAAIWGVASDLTDTIADWAISPPTGDCKDYAVTKRHQLLALGWPSRSLLLSDVVLPSGDHHLLLVVRFKDGSVVLDNLSNDIRLVSMTHDRYHWSRIQSPLSPMLWMGVQNATHIRAVDLGGSDR